MLNSFRQDKVSRALDHRRLLQASASRDQWLAEAAAFFKGRGVSSLATRFSTPVIKLAFVTGMMAVSILPKNVGAAELSPQAQSMLALPDAFVTSFPEADRAIFKRMPYPYRVLTRNIFNFDKLMRNLLKLEPLDCQFVPTLQPEKRAVYDGVGACLYRNVLSGLKYQGVPGTIRSHVRQMTTLKVAEISIEWRPAPNRTSSALKTLWRSIRGVIHPFQSVPENAPTLGQILNVIVLRFKSDADARVIFGDTIFDSVIHPEDGPIRQVVVQFSPGNEDPKKATDALVLFYQGDKIDPVYSVLLQTTFSLFDTKKPFDFDLTGNAANQSPNLVPNQDLETAPGVMP